MFHLEIIGELVLSSCSWPNSSFFENMKSADFLTDFYHQKPRIGLFILEQINRKLRNFKMESFCSEIHLTLEQVVGWGCWLPSVVKHMDLALSTHSYTSMDSTNLELCNYCSTYFVKKYMYSWTHRVQTHFDQGSTEAAKFFSFTF